MKFSFPEFASISAGYDHNWDGATDYAVKLMQAAPDTFDGVAFHCYSGQVSQQGAFSSLFPNKVGTCVIIHYSLSYDLSIGNLLYRCVLCKIQIKTWCELASRRMFGYIWIRLVE